uniref:Uncharacterized protein n=1 Tax=viral metagenome TaxID=1070528 RepID=A0A6C0I0W1_9ZZZZ
MENLAIIITGQLRTFFTNANNDFLKMIKLSKMKYANIFVICVINPSKESDISELYTFLNNHNISNRIIDYSLYKNEYDEKCIRKFNDPKMEEMIKLYWSSPKRAHIGISNPKQYSYNSTLIQYHQLQIGIRTLKKYIDESNISFDTICKTRFDCKYPTDFCPYIENKNNIIDTIAFNENNVNIIKQNMDQYGINTIDDLILFNKKTRLKLPHGHIPYEHHALALGGMACYNYESLENVRRNGIENILYSFNDYFYFAKTDIFLKLEKILDDSCLITCNNPDLYNHYFCPESQFIIFCLYNKIDIIMYPECFYDTMIYR